jgi:predicted SAM-dependent methyltransferase
MEVDQEKLDSSYVRKIAISKLTPYDQTVFIDADTLIVGKIDEIFDSINGHDISVTQFCNWSSGGRAIGRRIKGFAQYIPEETLEKALSFGPAVNTGVYGFPKNSPIFDEWLELAKKGQSSRLYIPDEIACQILLPKYNTKILDSKYNVSVKFGANDADKRVIHYHGRKHCRKFPLAEFWLKAFVNFLRNKEADVKEYISHDNNLRKFLKSQYGWKYYVDECLTLLEINNDMETPITMPTDEQPDHTNTTIVTACDPKYVECLKVTYPTWVEYKNINQFTIIVYVNGFEDNDSRLDFLRQHKNIKIIHWDMHNVDNHREKMLSSFVFGPARDVATKYWLKLDADAYAVNDKPLFHKGMENYVFCGHKWGYTKPHRWISALNQWSKKHTDIIDKTDVEIDASKIKKNKYFHHRTNSFIQLHKTEFIKIAAKLAGDRLPIPSQDTFLWFVATKFNQPTWRFNFKKYSGIYNKKTLDKIQKALDKHKTDQVLDDTTELKLNVGCGRKKYKTWINTDKSQLDITDIDSWTNNNIQPGSVKRILAEHVFEHLSETDRFQAINNFKQFIANDGQIRIAVPDGFHPDPIYIDKVKVNGSGRSADDHKFLYNYRTLAELFEKQGFVAKPLEFFDENGKFHFNEWSSDDGFIKRSSRFDRRNKKNKLSYTSLIIDFQLKN